MREILIYDVIGRGFFEDGVTAAGINEELKAANGEDVLVRINSPGGIASEGVTIKTLLDDYDGAVRVKVDGLAASAATIIALGGDHLEMAEGSRWMVHDPWSFGEGNERDFIKMASILKLLATELAGMYAKRTGGTPEEMRALMLEETWLSGKQAVEMGFVDEVSEIKAVACAIPAEFCYRHAPGPVVSPPLENYGKLSALARKRKIDLTRAQMRA